MPTQEKKIVLRWHYQGRRNHFMSSKSITVSFALKKIKVTTVRIMKKHKSIQQTV